MAYSETRIVIGGLAHVPVLIFIANFIKGKFRIKTEKTKEKWTISREFTREKFKLKLNLIKIPKTKIREIQSKLKMY